MDDATFQALRASVRIAAQADAKLRQSMPTMTEAQRAFLREEFGSDDVTIHYCNWSSQPDIHFACGVNTTPAWCQPQGQASVCHVADDGSAYTFDARERVTCEACIAAEASDSEGES